MPPTLDDIPRMNFRGVYISCRTGDSGNFKTNNDVAVASQQVER